MAAIAPFYKRMGALYRPTVFTRPLGNKLQEIAQRSPQDIVAFDTLADFVLARLNQAEAPAPPT
jgi:hypothetical protein